MKTTYGFDRKADVPADGGNAKVCPRCDLWFSAVPRQRLCDRCRPNKNKALSGSRKIRPDVPGCIVNAANAQVEGTKKPTLGMSICRELAMDAARHADYGNKRDCTGWCLGPCSCKCHKPGKMSAPEYGPDTAHVPDCPCEACADARPAEYRRPETHAEAMRADIDAGWDYPEWREHLALVA